MRLAQRIAILALKVFFVLVFCLFAGFSMYKNSQLSSKHQIQSSDNISNIPGAPPARVIRMSRNSAVNIMSMSETGAVAASSGTYIRYGANYYILTVNHGIIGQCESTRILVGNEFYECIEIAARNRNVDYAILKIEEIEQLEPISIPRHLPRNSEWDEALSIHTDTIYTGYPNTTGPLTIDGKIVGYSNTEDLFVHSYAWPGSSGSGVFNEQGRLIGYIMAVSLGYTEYGINVLEDIVIVVPIFKIDWSLISEEK